MDKQKIVEILMNRDEIDEAAAWSLVDETQEEIYDALDCGRYFEAEDILAFNLGLEMDYIWAFV